MSNKCTELINLMLSKESQARPSSEQILNSSLILDYMNTFNLDAIFPLKISNFFEKTKIPNL